VVDTHAGAGLYDLNDAMAQRSREAQAGIARLMADAQAPAVFAPLKAAVAAENPDGQLRYYPGSPLLTVKALRKGDRYVGCELREDDQAALQALLDRRVPIGTEARAVLADGYAELGGGGDRRRRAYIIDPPFERGDEYAQIIDGAARALDSDPAAVIAIWTPLKDLETFDFLLRGLEAIDPPSLLAVEARLRPLMDPMKMNGTAMLFINAPALEEDARAAAHWVVAACGERGGKAQVRRLVG
jgi:23S rRNA (adenine2030-N6)-methyltransferase